MDGAISVERAQQEQEQGHLLSSVGPLRSTSCPVVWKRGLEEVWKFLGGCSSLVEISLHTVVRPFAT